MILAADFMRKHNLSSGWASNTKRYYPDAFYFIGDRQYLYPEKIWYQSDDMNNEYNGLFFRKMNDLYFEMAEHFNDYEIAKLLSIKSKRNYNTWRAYLYRFKFKRGDKAVEFIDKCEAILQLIDIHGSDFKALKEILEVS